MTNSFRRVAALLTLLLVTQYVASANVRMLPSDSTAAKANPAIKAVKAPLTVASDPLPANVQHKVVATIQKEQVAQVVQQDKVVEVVQQEKVAEKPVAVQEPSVAEPLKVNEEETKSTEDKKNVELEAGHNIQGDGPFIVNAQQLPADVREEIMRQLNTQYRISQEKKLQQQQTLKEEVAQVKTDHMTSTEAQESFDPELAAGIAELLTRMAVEDDVGNQYVDLEDLPVGLRAQVTEYLMKEQKLEEDKEIEEQLKMQQQAQSIKAQEANFASFLKNQMGTEIDELLSSLIDEAVADYPASAAGFYPQRYGFSGYRQRPVYASGYPLPKAYPQYGGYPQYGAYLQYGGYPQFGGYPSGNRYQTRFRPYAGMASYPYAALGGYYPVSYSNSPYRPQDYLMAREQLANLYDRPFGPKPLPYRTIGGPVSSSKMEPIDYIEELKPEDQPSPLATYYAYYRQLFESQAKNAGSRNAQSARIDPLDFAVQQPRSHANYQIPRYFK